MGKTYSERCRDTHLGAAREKKAEHIFKFTVRFGKNTKGAEPLLEALAEKFPYWRVDVWYSMGKGFLLEAIGSSTHLSIHGDGRLIPEAMPDEQAPERLFEFLKDRTSNPWTCEVTEG